MSLPPLDGAPLRALDITRYRVRVISSVVTYGSVEDTAAMGDQGTPRRHRAENKACIRRTRAASRRFPRSNYGPLAGRNSELQTRAKSAANPRAIPLD